MESSSINAKQGIADVDVIGQQQAAAGVILAYDAEMLRHAAGEHERPERLHAIMRQLEEAKLLKHCNRLPVREATNVELLACHTPEHLDRVKKMSETAEEAAAAGKSPVLQVDGDLVANKFTESCARLAAGSCVDVSVAVARGEAGTGIAIVRPPGHHAESGTSSGFCFFNNAAVAARAAQAAGAKKVLILDWDIHHGDGTQEIFGSDPSVLFVSIHRKQEEFFSGTGPHTDVGKGTGKGFTMNIPWPRGARVNGDYLAAMDQLVLPVANEFQPDMVIVSAGFDAAEGDNMGGCHVTSEGFAHMTAKLQPIAPLVLLLEGGYNDTAIASASEACLRVLLGQQLPQLPPKGIDLTPTGAQTIKKVMEAQAQYWGCLHLPAPAPPPTPSPTRLTRKRNISAAAPDVAQEAGLPAKVQKPQANATPTACCAAKSQKPRAKAPKRIQKKEQRQQIVMPRQAEQATGQQEGLLEGDINWGGKNDAGWGIDLCASCDKTEEKYWRWGKQHPQWLDCRLCNTCYCREKRRKWLEPSDDVMQRKRQRDQLVAAGKLSPRKGPSAVPRCTKRERSPSSDSQESLESSAAVQQLAQQSTKPCNHGAEAKRTEKVQVHLTADCTGGAAPHCATFHGSHAQAQAGMNKGNERTVPGSSSSHTQAADHQDQLHHGMQPSQHAQPMEADCSTVQRSAAEHAHDQHAQHGLRTPSRQQLQPELCLNSPAQTSPSSVQHGTEQQGAVGMEEDMEEEQCMAVRKRRRLADEVVAEAGSQDTDKPTASAAAVVKILVTAHAGHHSLEDMAVDDESKGKRKVNRKRKHRQ